MLKSLDTIKDQESSKHGSSHLFVVIDFCSFEHRVVFQVQYLLQLDLSVTFFIYSNIKMSPCMSCNIEMTSGFMSLCF